MSRVGTGLCWAVSNLRCLCRIRALQVADLRARRLSGRHQISNDGKHLIDGVPFGKPFLKRSTASRPAITIPPRKRRRTTHAAWENRLAYGDEDAEWHPGAPSRSQELSVIRPSHAIHQKSNLHDEDEFEDYHDTGDRSREEDPDAGDATVIHHKLDEGASAVPADDLEDYGNAQESDSEHPSEDISEFEDIDMVDELEGLKEEMELSHMAANGIVDFSQTPHTGPYQLRARAGEAELKARKSSLSKHVADDGSARRDSKAVRFQGQNEGQKEKSPAPQPEKRLVSKAGSTSDEESANSSSDSSASDSSASSSDSESDSDSDSSDSAQSNSNASNSVTDTSSSSESDSDSDSDSDSSNEPETKITLRRTTNPPGRGSARTKKSNLRTKMRRRLSKLKELGALSAEADFTALREFEEVHGHQYYTDGTTLTKQQQEQAEFEARRQKLLRDLASGGVDISGTASSTGKENEAPQKTTRKENTQRGEQSAAESTPSEDEEEEEPEKEHSKRRTLDVASSRRMVFGSLGVRTPQSKEDEEKTRKKLAGKINHFLPRQLAVEKSEPTPVVSDADESWEDKLVVRATECVFDDIELTAPPFPFEQRWDREAAYRIKQLKGPSKKRRRKQKTQEYEVQEDYGNGGYYENGDGYWEGDYGNEGYEYGNDYGNEDYGNGEGYEEGNMELIYDDAGAANGDAAMKGTEQSAETEEDLPSMPENPSSLPALAEKDVKKGAVIAFKELDMSKATNWQPIVSEYRVAEVHDVLDNAFNLCLAVRDRKAARETEDDEDDEPEYSGFEMPGYDEDAEDDGFREKSFGDLIDPKLLQAAERAETGEAQDASMSVH